MKKYFSIDESLKLLNDNLKEYEKLNVRDLFLLAIQENINPCFYYYDYCLWQHNKKNHYYYEKIYPSYLRGYLSTNHLNERLLTCLDYNETSLIVKWAIEVDCIYSTAIQEVEDIRLIKYEDFTSGNLQKDFLESDYSKKECIHQIMNTITDGCFLEYVYYELDGVEIFFKDIYFTKQNLMKLEKLNTPTKEQLPQFQETVQLSQDIKNKEQTIEELQNHIRQLEAKQLEPKLSTREENNIIKVLAVLADIDAKIDTLKPYEAHGIMARKADLLGIETFPSSDSIKKWFSKADEYKKS